ncbi:hypothetical protein D187_002338 [Cystobacter fuscus DSM 2262]|uniref:Uncharacterized protein n=1 Tax=Cystobacter fuscus (strain ATCC 25194 / DSM 2262 / NBRC 100088 / M29) TaxID=1242864 RepID=S9PD80_CYSF2|nr:hypothetical protein [Cystobacter fuscus]EPX60252.1 hypothetical protein D187_002338 [Cystobacter fuscus DSM 2262]
MAVSPINRSLQSLIFQTLSKLSEVAPPSPPVSNSQTPSPVEENPYQSLFSNDGFDPSGAGGTQDLSQQIQALMQTMNQITELLGGEQGAGEEGGVPELGGAPKSGSNPEQFNPQQFSPPPTTPPATTTPPPTTEPGTQKTQGPQAPKGNNPTGGAGNTMDFTNDGDKPMTVTFTTNPGQQQIPPLTLQPGQTVRQEFPQGWSGNFRSDKGDGTAVTLGEVAFNGAGNQTFYDVSYIEGNNASMTIAPETAEGKTSGTMENLVEGAPDSILARDANGQVYGIKKTTTSEVRDPNIINYYRGKVGADEGYVDPKDDLSTLGTSDTHLEVHLKDVF